MRLRGGEISLCTFAFCVLRFVLLLRLCSLLFAALRSVPALVPAPACGWHGVWAHGGGVAQLEGCAVSRNERGDYVTKGGGRIEGVDPSLIDAR